jgi:hypothetical protein
LLHFSKAENFISNVLVGVKATNHFSFCLHYTARLIQVLVKIITRESEKCEVEDIKGGATSTFGMKDLGVD